MPSVYGEAAAAAAAAASTSATQTFEQGDPAATRRQRALFPQIFHHLGPLLSTVPPGPGPSAFAPKQEGGRSRDRTAYAVSGGRRCLPL
uniref:Putative secreted protein n=1 Tax=Anopheles darlingi TaxID=43151 RepID=A0A2M4DGA5_ANODA